MKRKLYSLISILGLGLGIGMCLVLWRYIDFETSYDKFHVNAADIYRVTSSFYTNGSRNEYLGYDVGPALKEDMPEIMRYARTHGAGDVMITVQGEGNNLRPFEEKRGVYADAAFLNVFTCEIIKGDKLHPLEQPNSAVLTASSAKKFFGDTDPVGRRFTMNGGWTNEDYTVTAVVKDMPLNSSIEFDFLLPMHNLLRGDFYRNNNARWDNFFTYVQLFPKSQLSGLVAKIPAFIKKYKGDDKNINVKSRLDFQPLTAIHFSPNLEKEGSYRTTIYFYILISVFILVIAWVNYINLSTARASERAKEVGVRKAIGVLPRQLVLQFLTESFLTNLAGIICAVGLAVLLLPGLEAIAGKKFPFDFTTPTLWITLGILLVVGSVASGIYPAFVLSSFNAAEVIKGKTVKVKGGLSMRKSLVVFQFASSLVLIACTFIVYRQIQFMEHQETGLNLDQMLIVRGPRMLKSEDNQSRFLAFKNQLRSLSFVDNVTSSSTIPGGSVVMNILMRKAGQKSEEGKMGDVTWVDPDFMPTYGIRVIAGEAWNPAAPRLSGVLINETAVVDLGFLVPEKAVGTQIVIGNDTSVVKGVLKDFHWNSFKEKKIPMVFYCDRVFDRLFSIHLKGGDFPTSLAQTRKQFELSFPNEPFDYYFLDDLFNSHYYEEQRFGKIFSLFSVFAALIACLGLWGLTSFTTLQRAKEISLRKVLGASASSIVALLAAEYVKLMLIAAAIVIPLIWFGGNQWLEEFPVHTGITPDLFIVPILSLTLLACATIGFKVFRAAVANPANALKGS